MNDIVLTHGLDYRYDVAVFLEAELFYEECELKLSLKNPNKFEVVISYPFGRRLPFTDLFHQHQVIPASKKLLKEQIEKTLLEVGTLTFTPNDWAVDAEFTFKTYAEKVTIPPDDARLFFRVPH